MKAWRLYGAGDFRLDEVPIPDIDDDGVLVKVRVVQASITDTEVIKGTAIASAQRALKRLSEGKSLQLGHEFCGEVVKVGRKVTSLQAGDRVSSTGSVHCGSCRMCLSGRSSDCLSTSHVGGEIPGAFAEYMGLPERVLVKIPDGPTDSEVATLQPLSSCIGSVYSAGMGMGDSVVVLGQGVIGSGVLQIAKLSGAGLLIGVDVRPENLELSRKFGATHTINAKENNVIQEVSQITKGEGADIVFDAAGGSQKHGLSGFETLQQALEIARFRGRVVQSAVLEGAAPLDVATMRRKRLTYVNPLGGRLEFLKLAALWVASGRIDVRSQVTHVLHGLEKLPEAIEITQNKAKYGAINPAQVIL
ncbi:zinc-binding dehydrogenase [Chloroflexota bacterium]